MDKVIYFFKHSCIKVLSKKIYFLKNPRRQAHSPLSLPTCLLGVVSPFLLPPPIVTVK